MNTEIIVHPHLHHIGLTTANLDPMIDWYRKVLGMAIVHRTRAATGNQEDVPAINAAWVSNDPIIVWRSSVSPAFLPTPTGRVTIGYNTPRSNIERLTICLVPMCGSNTLAFFLSYVLTPDRKLRSTMRTPTAIVLNSTLTTTVTAGHPASTCEPLPSSRKTQWVPISTPTKSLPRARRAHHIGSCTSARGKASLPPRSPTIRACFSS
jgi:hypothetical protein